MIRNHSRVSEFVNGGCLSWRARSALIMLAAFVLLPSSPVRADDEFWSPEGNGGRYVPAPEDAPPALEAVPGIIPFDGFRVLPSPRPNPGCPYKKKELKLLV